MALILTRKLKQSIYIEGGQFGPIRIDLTDIGGNYAKIGIQGDERYHISRDEILESDKLNQLELALKR